jgi:hypothetical protein
MLPAPNSSMDALISLGQATQSIDMQGIIVLLSVIMFIGLLIIIITNELL